jgi:hypothetical protein
MATRTAVVRGYNIDPKTIAAYLPANYKVVDSGDDYVLIEGEDSMGWTLDDYVIPRLASGNYFAKEKAEDDGPEALLAMFR